MIGGQNYKSFSRHKPKGQTLLELIVALGIFITIVGAIIGSFISAIAAERRAIANQEVLSNTRATIEIMVRAIRQADSDTIATSGCGSACLQFDHPNSSKGTVRYSLSGEQIMESNNGGAPFAITPSNVRVERLGFTLIGNDPVGGTSDQIQPRVTLTAAIRANPSGGPTLNLQTTVSLRSAQE